MKCTQGSAVLYLGAALAGAIPPLLYGVVTIIRAHRALVAHGHLPRKVRR